MKSGQTRFGEYLEFLQDLERNTLPHFLEGGQAVNFWAEYYSSSGRLPELKHFQPFTSKDCDVWAGYSVLQYLEKEQDRGRFRKGDSPADGQVGVFEIRGAPARNVDIMSGVYGIPASKLKRLRERSLSFNQVRVIDPMFLFQSKCHCLVGLDQTDRQDEKHLRMMVLILPEYQRELLDEARTRRITQRALINELKLLRQILRNRFVRRALERLALDPEALISRLDLEKCGLSRIERFMANPD